MRGILRAPFGKIPLFLTLPLGGYATAELNEILEYEKSSKQWLLVGNLFEARYYHAITTVLLRDVEQLCVSKKVKK